MSAKKKVTFAKKAEKQAESQPMSEDTKTIITVLILLLAYPIGVVVMWFLTKWPKWAKIIISLPMLLIPLLGIAAAAVLVAVNPTSKIEQARYCGETQCRGIAESSSYNACMKTCMDNYRSDKKHFYKYSPR